MQAHFGGRCGSSASPPLPVLRERVGVRASDSRFEIPDLKFETSDPASRRLRAKRRSATSIGQFLSSAHTICFTAVLQDDDPPHSPSVTVNQLAPPTLNGPLARRRPDEPARGGGVLGGNFPRRPQQESHPPAA